MDKDLEARIEAQPGPRVTPQQINDTVLATQYHQFPDTLTIVCCITLQNGFTVIGESACASPAQFDYGIGCDIAYNQAKGKIWALEGYLLKERLHRAIKRD